ncbi:carbohydrate sulfotransferase 10-like [Ylistrum balloti]|uniref:carbohydrate sulfotransferase 10-like n=1 Tax=Ylistrum balloti TaxID=509963 RepID=UPI0029058AA9|nr:carbohydrate sulfotransferase 10-like [Ylistrum balloti]
MAGNPDKHFLNIGLKYSRKNGLEILKLIDSIGKVTAKSPDRSQTHGNRKTILQEKCTQVQETDIDNITPVYFYSKSNNVAFCKAPKTGSTFIGIVVNLLEYEGNLKENMFYVNREIVHGRNEATLGTVMKRRSRDMKMTLVTRDPYTRLFSAYLDKYFILGIWGRELAKTIAKSHRKIRDGFCGFDISFDEFLNYVTNISLGDRRVDRHVLPVSSLCHPCSVRYDVICKQETLTSDTEHVLEVMNITDQKRRAVMDMIGRKTQKDNLPAFTADSVTSLIIEQIHRSPVTERQRLRQRERALRDAYDSVKSDTIAKVQTRFSQDFQLFSYDRSPPHFVQR